MILKAEAEIILYPCLGNARFGPLSLLQKHKIHCFLSPTQIVWQEIGLFFELG